MTVKINKTRVKHFLKKVIETRDNADLEGSIDKDSFVKVTDTSHAIDNDTHFFCMDIYSAGKTITQLKDKRFNEKFFETMFKNGILPNYDGTGYKTKCDVDHNFKENAEEKYLDLIMMDTVKTFGLGDHIVKEYNINGFQFFMKIRCDLPLPCTIKKRRINDKESLYLFKEVDMNFMEHTLQNRKDNIIIDVYVPCIIDKQKQIKQLTGAK